MHFIEECEIMGVKIMKTRAFNNCRALTDVEFGDMLETIEFAAFYGCFSLIIEGLDDAIRKDHSKPGVW